MRAGTLRHKVQFMSSAYAAQPIGTAGRGDLTWTTFTDNISASIKPLSGQEIFNERQVDPETTHEVRVRHSTETAAVTTADRIAFLAANNARIFEIKSIINPMERGNELILLCKETDVTFELPVWDTDSATFDGSTVANFGLTLPAKFRTTGIAAAVVGAFNGEFSSLVQTGDTGTAIEFTATENGIQSFEMTSGGAASGTFLSYAPTSSTGYLVTSDGLRVPAFSEAAIVPL